MSKKDLDSKKTSNATHTFAGWKYPESRNDPNDPADYFYDKDMAFQRAWDAREAREKKKSIKEDAPTNSMGASSSTPGTGAIDTYDPLILVKKAMKAHLKALLLRRPAPAKSTK